MAATPDSLVFDLEAGATGRSGGAMSDLHWLIALLGVFIVVYWAAGWHL